MSIEIANVNIWMNELDTVQCLPKLPSPGALFQTKAKYKKLKEQSDRISKIIEDIKKDGRKIYVYCLF